jgi:hypothetical protein
MWCTMIHGAITVSLQLGGIINWTTVQDLTAGIAWNIKYEYIDILEHHPTNVLNDTVKSYCFLKNENA